MDNIILWRFPLAVVLTLSMEGIVFLALNYRDKTFLKLFAAVNIASNLSLNMIMALYFIATFQTPLFEVFIGQFVINDQVILTIFLEVVVVFAEYGAFKALLGKSKKLFWTVVLANAFSAIIGSYLLSLIMI